MTRYVIRRLMWAVVLFLAVNAAAVWRGIEYLFFRHETMPEAYAVT